MKMVSIAAPSTMPHICPFRKSESFCVPMIPESAWVPAAIMTPSMSATKLSVIHAYGSPASAMQLTLDTLPNMVSVMNALCAHMGADRISNRARATTNEDFFTMQPSAYLFPRSYQPRFFTMQLSAYFLNNHISLDRSEISTSPPINGDTTFTVASEVMSARKGTKRVNTSTVARAPTGPSLSNPIPNPTLIMSENCV